MSSKRTPGRGSPSSPSDGDGSSVEDLSGSTGNRVPLTRQRVLATALQLVDAEGLDALTRRRLARELGRDVMTLYRYAPDQAALLDGIVELVLDELELPEEGQDWQTQLRRSAHNFRRLALAHPHVVNLLLTRPVATAFGLRPPATLRPVEHFLELLTTAGSPAADALRIHRAYVGFLYGHLLAELQDTIVNPDETDDLLRLGLHQLPPRQFPILRSLASDLADYHGERELDHGLDMLVAGITATHAAAPPSDGAAMTAPTESPLPPA